MEFPPTTTPKKRMEIMGFSVEETIAHSTAIVVARLDTAGLSSSSHDQVTSYSFRVIQHLKGGKQDIINVTGPGSVAPFTPRFGQKYLLFLLSKSQPGKTPHYSIMTHNLSVTLAFPLLKKNQLGGRKPSVPDWQTLTLDRLTDLTKPYH